MPRRKKHQKSSKNKHKKRQGTKPQQKSLPCIDVLRSHQEISPYHSETVVSSSSADFSTPLRAPMPKTPQNAYTTLPLTTPSVNKRHNPNRQNTGTPKIHSKTDESFRDSEVEITPFKATPVNIRRSLNRQKDARLSGTWNVTNLNVLFDSNVSLHGSDVCLTVKSGEKKRRSSSSIPKLHSPGKEKPLSVSKSTQTGDGDCETARKSEEVITETPKASQVVVDIDTSQPPQLNNIKNLSNKMSKFGQNEVNKNPYTNNRDLRWHKEGSIEETSFFSPQLFEMKSSSTPIEKMQEIKLLSYLKESILKENIINNRFDGTPLREVSNTPRAEKQQNKDPHLNNSLDLTIIDSLPCRRENINVNTPPLSEKCANKDQSKLLLSNKRNCRLSPKVNRLVNNARVFNKSMSYSRLNTSRRSSLENSNIARLPGVRIGIYEKMMNRIKRYSRASAKWSVKMIDMCAQLGIQVKNSLSTLCTAYNETSMLECSQKSCSCEEYREEINNLNVKIGQLNSELNAVKQQIEDHSSKDKVCGESIEKLHRELEYVKQELNQFTDLRSELASLKEQFQCLKSVPTPPSVIAPPPPPMPPCAPPPPPPPPPPMPMATAQKAAPKLGLGKRSKSVMGMGGSADSGDSRPVISLDDILKVKLKKASDRPVVTPLSRRSVPPSAVSMDMLRQVKLRPSARPSLHKTTPSKPNASTPGTNSTSSEASTSPHSSLCRLLNGDSSAQEGERGQVAGIFDVRGEEGPGW